MGKREKKRKDPNKIYGKEKFSYALLSLGNVPISMMVASFLLAFYTNVIGLDPAACATLFLIARIVDGINDPLVGFFLDHFPNTKWGHFRVTISAGAIICSLNFAMLWLGPLWSPGFKLGIAYICYLLQGILFPVMDISLNSLMPVMSTDKKERDSLSAVRSIASVIGGVAVGIIGPVLIADASQAGGYLKMLAVVVGSAVILSCLGAMGVKERVVTQKGKSYSFKDLFKVLSLKPVWVMFLGILMYQTATNVASTVSTYFYTYVIDKLTLMSVTMLISMATMFVGIAMAGKLSDKIGKKACFLIGVFSCDVLILLRLLDITNVPFLCIVTAIQGVGTGILTPIIFTIQADNTDYAELKMNQRVEGAVASLASFSTKFAGGIAAAIPGYLLAWVGFDGTAAVQPQSVVNMVILCTTVIPAVIGIISMIIVGTQYPLTKEDVAQQQIEITKRHQGER